MVHGIAHPSKNPLIDQLQSAQTAGNNQGVAAASGQANDAFASLLLEVMSGDGSTTGAVTGTAVGTGDSATGIDASVSALELLFGSNNATAAALQQALTSGTGLAGTQADADSTTPSAVAPHRHPDATSGNPAASSQTSADPASWFASQAAAGQHTTPQATSAPQA